MRAFAHASKQAAAGTHVPGVVSSVLRSPARSLEPAAQMEMGARFDFSRVRIHDDSRTS
jgi:hypothetical protein